ncbi:MAG TPA: NUDIX hydrolase [Anaerolineae bacterium]
METWIRKEALYRGRIFSLVTGEARLDDGGIVTREVIEHNGGVAIVPLVADSVVLIRQFRIAIGREILELPAGRLEGDEDPEQRARQELEEEIGYRAARMIPVASYYSSVGFTNERMHIYLALDLSETARKPESDERIASVRLSIPEVKLKLAARAFEDSKTIIGLREMLSYLEGSFRNDFQSR